MRKNLTHALLAALAWCSRPPPPSPTGRGDAGADVAAPPVTRRRKPTPTAAA